VVNPALTRIIAIAVDKARSATETFNLIITTTLTVQPMLQARAPTMCPRMKARILSSKKELITSWSSD
jgi:hypothetical protein